MSSSSATWRCFSCGDLNTNRKICGCGQKFRNNYRKNKKKSRKNGGQRRQVH